jgi:hypothetical protein
MLMAWTVATACLLAQPSEAEMVTLRFGQIPSTVRGTSSVYLHIAEKKGFFARENLHMGISESRGEKNH